MKALAAAALLAALVACSTVGAVARPAQPSSAHKPLPAAPPPPPLTDDSEGCVADVKQCPDGSQVGRSPAQDCAFDACPGANNHK